jgi:hypothetical protein
MGIQLPQRGQPMDYSYLYQLVEQVNALSAELARSKTINYFNNGTQTRDKLSASETKIAATTYKFSDKTNTGTKGSTSKTITLDSGSGFLYPPVVTVTAQVPEPKDSDITVGITSITTNSVTVQVNYDFTKTTKFDVILNIIAVGVRR